RGRAIREVREMANAAQHATIGILAGAGTYLAMCSYYNRQPSFGEFLLCAGVGLFTGGVPDRLEPAVHSHHRQLAHSFSVGGLLAKFASEKCGADCEWDQFQKILLAVGVAGYLS